MNYRKEERMTPIETLKAKLEKREAEAKELKKQVKEAELAEHKAKENLAKLEANKDKIRDAVQTVLSQAGVSLPEDKAISITASETGLVVNLAELTSARKGGGNGGAKAITFEGQQMSWAKLCVIKGVSRTPGGSAHRDVYNRARNLHNSVPHECSIDRKVYPIS